MSQFDTYDNLSPDYIPDNTTPKKPVIKTTIDYSIPHDAHNIWGETVAMSWCYGDTLSLPINLTKVIKVSNSAIIYTIVGQAPTEETEAEIDTYAYNLSDVKCWKLTNITNGNYIWTSVPFEYFDNGAKEVFINPNMQDKKLVCTIFDFKGGEIISTEIENTSVGTWEIDEETAAKLVPGIYYMTIKIVSENETRLIDNCKIYITEKSSVEIISKEV